MDTIPPYVPCADLVISIDQHPCESWILDFFTRLESNEIISLTLTGPRDRPNRLYELGNEVSKAICGWITRAEKLRRVIIRQMRITNGHMKGLQKALAAKIG